MLYFPSQAGPPRVMAPRGIDMRKVRASQGRITDNVRRRKLPGKCNRNRLPKPTGTVQMERRGKSSPARQATVCKCKPYPMQRLHAGILLGHAGPAEPRRRLRGGWRQPSQIDGSCGVRSVQNPAYKSAGEFRSAQSVFYGQCRGGIFRFCTAFLASVPLDKTRGFRL